MKANLDIRSEIEAEDIRMWEIADHLGVSDSSFSRSMRKEFSPEKKARIRSAILDIKIERLKSYIKSEGECEVLREARKIAEDERGINKSDEI